MRSMVTDITEGIKVTVETDYQPEYSNPGQSHFVFSYRITIENQGNIPIQLMSRHWEIIDATYPFRQVDGEGVVGKQPKINPGQLHQYVSGCNLRSGFGKMYGHYGMTKLNCGTHVDVNIPEFVMIVPYFLN